MTAHADWMLSSDSEDDRFLPAESERRQHENGQQEKDVCLPHTGAVHPRSDSRHITPHVTSLQLYNKPDVF